MRGVLKGGEKIALGAGFCVREAFPKGRQTLRERQRLVEFDNRSNGARSRDELWIATIPLP
jgi:hypothetical protein